MGKISRASWLETNIPRVITRGWILTINANGFGWGKATCPSCGKFMAGVVFRHPNTVGKTLVVCGSCQKMTVKEPAQAQTTGPAVPETAVVPTEPAPAVQTPAPVNPVVVPLFQTGLL
jgi:ribosomal protein S27AE